MPGRVLSEPEMQPAEVPALVALAGVLAGRVPATKVAASASVLRICGREETDYGQQDQKDARRPQKEGSSSGHGLARRSPRGPHSESRNPSAQALVCVWTNVVITYIIDNNYERDKEGARHHGGSGISRSESCMASSSSMIGINLDVRSTDMWAA